MSAQHTPGPWFIDDDIVVNNGIAVRSEDYGVAKVWNYWAGEAATNKANARLISAAPDMLAALKLARDALGANAARDAVDNAIARAEGASS